MTLHNQNGKPLDDLDTLKLRVLAQELVGRSGFSIESEDGVPVLGYLPNNAKEVARFTATGWKTL